MAGRIRSIKPELLEDAKTSRLSDRGWRLFVSLFLVADDQGLFRAEAALVESQVFWGNPAGCVLDYSETLARMSELLRAGLIELYEVRGQRYGRLVGWKKHQKIDHPSAAKVPTPEQADKWLTSADSSEALDDPREASRSLAKDSETLAPDQDLDQDQDLSCRVGASTSVRKIFDYWAEQTGHKAAKLDSKRRTRIQARLSEGSEDDLLKAIRGALKDDWLMGRDPKSTKRYDGIETIFRDRAQVERLMDLDDVTPGTADVEVCPL